MSQSKFERYKRLLGGEENLPKQVFKPAHTESQLAAAAPDSSLSTYGPLDERTFDTFFGTPYVNRNLEIVDNSDDSIESNSDPDFDSLPAEQPETRSSPAPKRLTESHTTKTQSNTTRPASSQQAPLATRSNMEHSPEPFKLDDRYGEVAPLGIRFAPIVAVSKFPYKFIAKNISEAVANKFFNGGKFWERSWDLYYTWSPHHNLGKPIILIPEHQFTSLVEQVDLLFPSHTIRIPADAEESGLICDFPTHPDLRPRWLGQSTTRAQYDFLATNATMFKMKQSSFDSPDDRSVEAYKALVEAANEAAKQKSKAVRIKKKEINFEKQQDMARQLERAQRYLGLRPWGSSRGMSGADNADGIPESPLPALNASSTPPYPFDLDSVIIAVDVESFERNNKLITEIGVATLDTRDLLHLAPGANGSNWFSKIRARHIRVKEYMHLVNKDLVQGCPDRFEFGKSEIVSKQDAPKVVAACFKPPFSGPIGRPTQAESAEKRNILFLGHDSKHDIGYLIELGYNPLNLSNLVEILDTALMFRSYSRESNGRSLGHILYEMDIAGWNLHNAGNDAVYTLQAMLAMCVRDAERRGEKAGERAVERESKIAEKIERAKQTAEERAREDAMGWSQDEDEDGGVAVKMQSMRL